MPVPRRLVRQRDIIDVDVLMLCAIVESGDDAHYKK